MKFLRRFLIRFSNFAAKRSADQRLQEEIAEHIAFQTEENVRAGMSPAEQPIASESYGPTGTFVLSR